MKGGLQFCRCCRKAVPRSVYEDHLEQTKLQVEAEVGKLAILDSPANPPVFNPATSAPRPNPEQNPDLRKRPGRQGTPSTSSKQASAKPSSHSQPHPSSAVAPPPQTDQKASNHEEDRAHSVYRELRRTENEIIKRYAALESGPLHKLSARLEPPTFNIGITPKSRKALLQQVRDERAWMVEQIHRLRGFDHILDIGNREFAHAILERLQEQMKALSVFLEPPSQRPPGVPTYKSGKTASLLALQTPLTTLSRGVSLRCDVRSSFSHSHCHDDGSDPQLVLKSNSRGMQLRLGDGKSGYPSGNE